MNISADMMIVENYVYMGNRNVSLLLCLLSSVALGQIMLYVDGMNGVINHNETIQWLYTLIGSKVREGFT